MTNLPVPSSTSAAPVVCSFDVFDTVLTRTVSPPTAAFMLVGRRAAELLPPGYTPRAFAEARQAAEQRVLRWHGAHMTLDAIYRELEHTIHTADWARIKEIELEVEHELLIPVPDGQKLLENCRKRGHAVVFVSDMYLPHAFIQTQLDHHGLWMPADRLFVSCDYGCKKGHGLFDVVCETLDISPTHLTHYGNCPHADVQGMQTRGGTGVHVTAANPSRYEAALGQWSDQTNGLSALMAGASRYARLHQSANSPHERALRSVASGVLAPVCTSFAMWLLQQAKAHQLTRLYVTARDGHVLLPIFRYLASLMEVECEIRYLYVSRSAVAAAYHDPDVWDRSFEFDKVGMDTVTQRIGALSSGIAAQKSMMEPSVKTSGLQADAHAHERRQLLCEYLRQEGLDAPPRSGFVDVGWKGTVHSLLNDVLLDEGMIDTPLPGFFFGLSAKQQEPHKAHRTAYFFDAHRDAGYRNVLQGSGMYTLLETFCTADHGSVIGYEHKDNSVRPVLEPAWPARMEAWGLPIVRNAVDAFLEGLTQHPALFNATADMRPALAKCIQLFWDTPTAAEAEAWGQFPREQGGAHEKDPKPLAPRYTWSAPAAFARYGSSAHERLTHKFSWPAASLQRSSPAIRRSIEKVLAMREKARWVYHALRRRGVIPHR
ncbi:hypothetical protein [Longimonas halophila]|nr:hypothetical protein [Longimonas halophila]